jgi:hypothetical protein
VAPETAAERQDELLHGLDEDEELLREAVHELAEATEQKLDITKYIRESPIAWLAGAFCVGLWLGMANERPEPPSETIRRQIGPLDYRRLRR